MNKGLLCLLSFVLICLNGNATLFTQAHEHIASTISKTASSDEKEFSISWVVPQHCKYIKVTDYETRQTLQSGDRVPSSHEIQIEIAPEADYTVKHAYENGSEIYSDNISPEGVVSYSLVLENDAQLTFSVEKMIYCQLNYEMELPHGILNVYNKYDNFNRVATGSTFIKDTPFSLVVTPDKGTTVTAIKANGKNIDFSIEKGEAVVGTFILSEDTKITVEMSAPERSLSNYTIKFNHPLHAKLNVIYSAMLKHIESGATVKEGRSVKFLVGPNKGYYVESILLNGEKVIPTSFGNFKEYDYIVNGNDSIQINVVKGNEPKYHINYIPDYENGIVELYKHNASYYNIARGRKNAIDYAGTMIKLVFKPDSTAKVLSVRLNGKLYPIGTPKEDENITIETKIPFKDLDIDVEFSKQKHPSPIVPIRYRVEPETGAEAVVFSQNSKLIIDSGNSFKVGRKLGLLINPNKDYKIVEVLFNGKPQHVWKRPGNQGLVPFTLQGEVDIIVRVSNPTGIQSINTNQTDKVVSTNSSIVIKVQHPQSYIIYNIFGQVVTTGIIKDTKVIHLPKGQFYIVKLTNSKHKVFVQ